VPLDPTEQHPLHPTPNPLPFVPSASIVQRAIHQDSPSYHKHPPLSHQPSFSSFRVNETYVLFDVQRNRSNQPSLGGILATGSVVGEDQSKWDMNSNAPTKRRVL